MRPYSMGLRRRVVAACDRKDERQVKIAERFGVSTAWIRRLLQRRRETGSIAPFPQNPGRKLAPGAMLIPKGKHGDAPKAQAGQDCWMRGSSGSESV